MSPSGCLFPSWVIQTPPVPALASGDSPRSDVGLDRGSSKVYHTALSHTKPHEVTKVTLKQTVFSLFPQNGRGVRLESLPFGLVSKKVHWARPLHPCHHRCRHRCRHPPGCAPGPGRCMEGVASKDEKRLCKS